MQNRPTILNIINYTAFCVFKPLDGVHHSVHSFITSDTHHCVSYRKVRWLFPSVRRDVHGYLFIYKAILHKLPPYSISPQCYSERSVMPLIPHTRPNAQCSLMKFILTWGEVCCQQWFPKWSLRTPRGL